MSNRYWIILFPSGYLVDAHGEFTPLKTKAGRLRNKHLALMKEGFAAMEVEVEFIPTTYKPKDALFIEPIIWWFIHGDCPEIPGLRI
jgi:hypothetical protein